MNRSRITLMIGAAIVVVAACVRLNARSIAWPTRGASWGNQVEATSFYAEQLAITDVSNLFLAFGLVLVAAVLIKGLFQRSVEGD